MTIMEKMYNNNVIYSKIKYNNRDKIAEILWAK